MSRSLSYEEIPQVIRAGARLGISRIRITGENPGAQERGSPGGTDRPGSRIEDLSP